MNALTLNALPCRNTRLSDFVVASHTNQGAVRLGQARWGFLGEGVAIVKQNWKLTEPNPLRTVEIICSRLFPIKA